MGGKMGLFSRFHLFSGLWVAFFGSFFENQWWENPIACFILEKELNSDIFPSLFSWKNGFFFEKYENEVMGGCIFPWVVSQDKPIIK